MTINVSLSDLTKIATYLEAKNVQVNAVETREQVQALKVKLVELRAKWAEADAEYRRASDEIDQLRKAHRAEFDMAESRLTILVWPNPLSGWMESCAPLEVTPEHPRYRADRAAGLADYWRTKAEYDAVRYRRANTSTRDAIAAEIRGVERQVDNLERELVRIENAAERAMENLPQPLLTVDDATLELIAQLTIDNFDIPEEPDFETNAEIAAFIRGEISAFIHEGVSKECDCHAGYVAVSVLINGIDVVLNLNDTIRHPLCHERNRFNNEWLNGAIPAKHADHRLFSLHAWPLSPISIEHQREAIASIPSTPEGLFGWLMLGPAGSSKTTYAAAAITDWLTFRLVGVAHTMENVWERKTLAQRVNYWRVKAPKWTRDIEAYETRDFGDRNVVEPSVTVSKIERTTRDTGWPPILWLEELDKFQSTKNRLRNLYCLVDAVYEAGGTIVSTANEPAADLEKLLGAAIYRRLSGTNDDQVGYLVMDAHKRKKRTKSN